MQIWWWVLHKWTYVLELHPDIGCVCYKNPVKYLVFQLQVTNLKMHYTTLTHFIQSSGGLGNVFSFAFCVTVEPSRLPYSTDSYFHTFGICICQLTNISNISWQIWKNASGKSCYVEPGSSSLDSSWSVLELLSCHWSFCQYLLFKPNNFSLVVFSKLFQLPNHR